MTRKFNPRSPQRSLSQESATAHPSPILGPRLISSSSNNRGNFNVKSKISQQSSNDGPDSNNGENNIKVPIRFASVHQRNLHIASKPLIFFFEVASIAVFQVFA